jgi:chromosome segregation ATPase
MEEERLRDIDVQIGHLARRVREHDSALGEFTSEVSAARQDSRMAHDEAKGAHAAARQTLNHVLELKTAVPKAVNRAVEQSQKHQREVCKLRHEKVDEILKSVRDKQDSIAEDTTLTAGSGLVYTDHAELAAKYDKRGEELQAMELRVSQLEVQAQAAEKELDEAKRLEEVANAAKSAVQAQKAAQTTELEIARVNAKSANLKALVGGIVAALGIASTITLGILQLVGK